MSTEGMIRYVRRLPDKIEWCLDSRVTCVHSTRSKQLSPTVPRNEALLPYYISRFHLTYRRRRRRRSFSEDLDASRSLLRPVVRRRVVVRPPLRGINDATEVGPESESETES